jgi:hypothetical protein
MAKRKKPGAKGRTAGVRKHAGTNTAKRRKAAALAKSAAKPDRAPRKRVAAPPDMPPRRRNPEAEITSWQGNSDQVAGDVVRHTAELRRRQLAALVEAQNAIAELRLHLPLGPIETKDIDEAEDAVANLQERPAAKSKLENLAEKFSNAVQDERVKKFADAIERILDLVAKLEAVIKLFTG